ncbi:hypothetical protein ARMSODRAFT_1018069 [Armillaria solidipes]|uniref:Uncharacterized protein n=1 Tax=Armillaria solidipes TaxID=1076256 RepID=A0A2H3BLJ7_9AGAR|nr:hypothetical protein ARMSODRAFT_1018069 [Armillaria solidipes]
MSEANAPQNKVSLNDKDPETINKLSYFIPISEDAEECNDSAIKRLKKQLRGVATSAALAGWKIAIHAGGLSPGIVETERIFLSIGENANGQSWAAFDRDCEEHVTESFTEFLASTFPLDKCNAFQEKMADFLPTGRKKAVVSRANRDFTAGIDTIGPNKTEESARRGDYEDGENTANMKTSSTGVASLSGTLWPRTPWSDFTLEPDATPHADNIDAEIISCDAGLKGKFSNPLSFQPYSGDVTDGWALPNEAWNYSSMDPNYMNSANSPPLPPPNSQIFDLNAATNEYESVLNKELEEMFPTEWRHEFVPVKIKQSLRQSNPSLSLNDLSTLQPNPSLNLFSNPSMLQQSFSLNSLMWSPNTSMHIDPQPFIPRSTLRQLYSPSMANEVVPHAPSFKTDKGERINAGRDEATGGGGVIKGVGARVNKGKGRQGGIRSTALVNGIGPSPRQLRASSNQGEGSGGDLSSDDSADDADDEAKRILKEAEWLRDSVSLLWSSSNLGEEYAYCINKWYELEVSLPVRGEGRICPQSRPEALTHQIGRRFFSDLPVLSPLQQQTLITDTMVWWNFLQNRSRQSTDACRLPLPNYTGDMTQINKIGRRGMFQIVYFVRWWGTWVQESNLDAAEWRAFTMDVTACCEAMLERRKIPEVAAKKRSAVERKGSAKRARTTVT